MNKFSLILTLFISAIGYSQIQETEPTFYTEISAHVAPRDYYNLKFGHPSEIIVDDTIIMANSETWIEKHLYEFESQSEFKVKKYRNNELVADEIIELDSANRILNYEGNLKYEGGKWYVTKFRYQYQKNKKIKEKINDSGKTYMRYTVKYDSLKYPTAIESTIVASGYMKLQAVDYDYTNNKFILMDFNHQGRLEEETKGNFNPDYIIETNEKGDIIKMYWILTDKNEPYIQIMDYEYDERGNWIRLVKDVVSPDGTIKPYHRTCRKIKYKN